VGFSSEMNINVSEEREIKIGIGYFFNQYFLRSKWLHTAVNSRSYKSRTKALHLLTTRCIVLHRQM
jgi:hypothetical protein